ncbi:hypothetical protein CC1G_02154 [Coprinopsis cinerea okayama7|uniref:Uncharacterized protein n=1 Tax=Coprinopsis cinerea (strain Okayama-7 / 130 / ATCC MYA-4618 / FGSC 9003) TaxID=240176 RepID=A8NKD6_COPC7|nr:hypothetical protein CC1G_02154 [Coprinopsis cinerea okayama7\|eukprot:XP_001834418.2 hypothetical protein CC1G_02154 [Coprinopsis cinerea okayama7\
MTLTITGAITGNAVVTGGIMWKEADSNDPNRDKPNKVLAYKDDLGRVFYTREDARRQNEHRRLVICGNITSGVHGKVIEEVWVDDPSSAPEHSSLDNTHPSKSTTTAVVPESGKETLSGNGSHSEDDETSDKEIANPKTSGERSATASSPLYYCVAIWLGISLAIWRWLR